MKKLLILSLFIASAMVSRAQITPMKKSNGQQTTPVIALPTTISKTALSRLPKQKDLALSDLQIQKDIVTGLYTISCKITNVGTNDVFLNPISYSKCNNQDYVTEQNTYIVHCKIEPENCSLSACGVSSLLYVYKPDGNFFSYSSYISDEARTLKPGQSFIAKNLHPTSIYWNKPSPCSSTRIEVMLTLDPINRLGDQDLSNNVLKVYFPIQN